MKSIAAFLLLATTVAGVAHTSNYKLHRLTQSLSKSLQTNNGQTCQTTVNRVKKPTIDYNSIIAAGQPFTDPDFQLSNDGFYWPTLTTGWYTKNNYAPGKTYELARARSRLPNATLFGTTGAVTPNDLDQGQLGDCYFLASCASLAEWSGRLEPIFVTQDYNQAGIIVIKGMVLGNPTTIVIDDIVPFLPKNSSSLLFDKPSAQGSLWAVFLEKAWAKLNGNYELTNGGNPDEVFQFLLGLPSVTYYNGYNSWQTVDDVWNYVVAGAQNQYIMNAASYAAGGNDSDVNSLGLADNHEYSILGSYIVYNADGTQKARLFHMRNPWGIDGKYNASWNDKDPIWNDTVNQYYNQVPYVNANDGEFFINDTNFQITYGYINIAFYDPTYVSSTSSVYNDTGYGHQFTFTLTSATDGFFGVDFYSPRMYPKGCKLDSNGNFVYAQGTLRVFLNGVEVSNSKTTISQSDDYGFVRQTWLPGNYTVLFYQTSWHTDDVQDFSFRALMPVSLSITHTAYTCAQDLNSALNLFSLAGSIAQTNYTTTDSLGISYRTGWYGYDSGYQYGIQGASGLNCQIKFTVSGYGGSGTFVNADVSTANCNSVVTTTSAGQIKTSITCTCSTYSRAGGPNACNYMFFIYPDSNGSASASKQVVSKSCS